MTVDISVVITLVVLGWTAGLFVGLFTAKFVGKKECAAHRAQMWDRLDGIQDVLSGGRLLFELRQVKPKQDE